MKSVAHMNSRKANHGPTDTEVFEAIVSEAADEAGIDNLSDSVWTEFLELLVRKVTRAGFVTAKKLDD